MSLVDDWFIILVIGDWISTAPRLLWNNFQQCWMDFVSFAKIISDESLPIQFLESKYTKNIPCPFCKNKTLYTMKSRDRMNAQNVRKISNRFLHQSSL